MPDGELRFDTAWNASPIKRELRVILTERSEVDGESRRQPAVTSRADSNGAGREPPASWPSLTVARDAVGARLPVSAA